MQKKAKQFWVSLMITIDEWNIANQMIVTMLSESEDFKALNMNEPKEKFFTVNGRLM